MPARRRELRAEEDEQFVKMWREVREPLPVNASASRKDVIRGYKRALSKLGLLNARTEADVRNRLMDRQGETLQASEPEIIAGTGAAPPGAPPPTATRTADPTEPRPAGGVFDSKRANDRISVEDNTAGVGQHAQRDEIVAPPPARPPDRPTVQSDRTNSEARESGPFSLEGREPDAPLGLSAGPRIIDLSKSPPKQGVIFTDLGPHTFRPGDTPLGQAAQEHVLANGRLHDAEFLLVFDAQGTTIAHGYGSKDDTGMPQELRSRIRDPKEALVLHHNHPDNTAISPGDLRVLALPGVHAIWAYGHGGAVSRAALTEAARKKVAADPDGGADRIRALALEAQAAIEHVVEREILRRGAHAPEAIEMYSHLADLMMHNAGIIEYKSNIDVAPLIAKLDLAPYLEAGIAEIRRQFYGEGTHVSNNGRHAGRRHPGEAGATFALPDAAAAERGRARSGDP